MLVSAGTTGIWGVGGCWWELGGVVRVGGCWEQEMLVGAVSWEGCQWVPGELEGAVSRVCRVLGAV